MRIPNKFNGYAADGTRLLYKGKGGGSNSAAKLEKQRQAQVQAAVDAINKIFNPQPYTAVDPDTRVSSVEDFGRKYYTADGKEYNVLNGLSPFSGNNLPLKDALANGLYTGIKTIYPENSRESLYNDQQQAIYDLNAKSVKDQYADAERANRFGLARNGLLGGSADIESNANLQEKANEGMIQAQALGQQAASDLRSSDEQAKQNLIAMAQSGIDTGTAQQMAISSLNANAQSALGQRGGAAIGNLFENLGQAYLTNQLMKAYQGGYNFGNPNYGSMSSSRGGDQGSIR